MRKLVCLLLPALLLSCRPLPSLLVLLDPYYAELLAAEGMGAVSLRKSLGSSCRVRVQPLDTQAAGEAEGLIRAARPEWVFLSPFLPLDAEELASRLPDVRFLREQTLAPQAPNLRRLRFRRAEALRDAGRIAARLLTRPALRPVLAEGGGPEPRASLASPKAGVLQAVATPQGALEAQAFREGFLSEAGSELLVERTIGSLTDTAQARRVLDKMREEGVALFLLQTYSQSGFCLELLRSAGGVAILEAGAGREAFRDQVVLWVEEDLPGALRGLSVGAAAGSLGPASGEVSGPVRLRAGAPLAGLPARDELEFPEVFE